MKYPESPKKPNTEHWHGNEIEDPYSWLEGEGEAISTWTLKQNALTHLYLEKIPQRAQIHSELKKLFDTGFIGCPFVLGRYTFQWRRTGSQNQSVLYVKPVDNKEEILIDPNLLSTDGTTAINWTSLTPDGCYIAYGISEGGSENSVLKVRSVKTKQDFSEQIPFTRHSSVAWLSDASGFYYARYPEPGTVPPGEENYHRRIFFHALGKNWKEDALLFEAKDPHNDWPDVSISDNGKWIQISISHGWTATDVFISPSGNVKNPKLTLRPVFIGQDAQMEATEFKDYLYMRTNDGAPRYKIMRVALTAINLEDKTQWEEIVAEEKGTLNQFGIVGGQLILHYQDKACSRLEIMEIGNRKKHLISLPTLGNIGGFTGESDQPILYYSFDSYAFPTTLFRLDIESLKQQQIEQLQVNTDLSKIFTEQITYRSKDGTSVTMFIVRNQSLQKTGNTKTILSGYGGFNISETPSFSKNIVRWVQSGGIYAVANLRGGGEYGEDWHRAGMLEKKQNVFDDFIAAAEYLIREGYTQPKKLAIQGGSNGGLLVGAAMVQRPELFGAVICQVPLLDMIHYDRTKIAKLWLSEYGDPSNPKHFQFLYPYSPYHHVLSGKNYPAIFLITAENDSRVDPMHARKMTAALQNATASNNPILLLVEMKAGHGAGKPISKRLEESTDVYAFLESVLL
ncbi:MAG: prolyl oligopeptidase family serine peptidase [Planctomycetota bacterium]